MNRRFALVAVLLKQMDTHQHETAEPVWDRYRDLIEDAMGLRRGALDTRRTTGRRDDMTTMIEAIALLDAVLGVPTPEQAARERERFQDADLRALGIQPHTMSGIQTKGCPRCGGTMRRTRERDGSGSQWVCQNYKCATVE